jgi:hypothetical protein
MPADPNVYLGTRNPSSVSVTDMGVDNTGATDAGAQANTLLARMVSGQTAWWPKGTYEITTAIVNTHGIAFAFAQGAVFTGANAASVQAANGNTVTAQTPSLYPALAISQSAHETVTLWEINNTTETPFEMTQQSVLVNSTYDNLMRWGFNTLSTVSGPAAYWTIAQDVENPATVHNVEIFIEVSDPAVFVGTYQPLGIQYVRGVGTLNVDLKYSDLGGAGNVSIVESSTAATQVKWLTGEMQLQPTNYEIVASNGLLIETSAGTVTFAPAATTALVISSTAITADVSVTFTAGATASGAVAFDLSGSSGAMKTTTGTLTIESSSPVVINPNEWQWNSTAAPLLDQASESTAIKGADFTIAPQQSTHATDQGGGNFRVNFQAPTGAGVEAGIKVFRGAVNTVYIGAIPGLGGYAAIYLGGTGVTLDTGHEALYSPDGTNTTVNGASGVHLAIGTTDALACTSTTTTISSSVLNLAGVTTTTSATGGSASALPTDPVGYVTISIAGVAHKIPYYT